MSSKCIKSDKPSGHGHRTTAFLSFFSSWVFFEVISKVFFFYKNLFEKNRKFTLILALFDEHFAIWIKSVSKKLAQNAVVIHCAVVCASFF